MPKLMSSAGAAQPLAGWGLTVTGDFALVEPQRLEDLMKEVAASRPQAITTFCTNLRAARLAEQIESRLDIPLLDTVSTTVWGMLRAVGADPKVIRGWGQLFDWA